MRPVLVEWLARHGLPVWLAPDYMILVGLSSLLCAIYVLRLARRDGADVHVHARALLIAYVAAIPGGYLFEAIRTLRLDAGRAAYGGLIAAVGAAVLYLRRREEPIAPFLDRIAVPAGVIFGAVRTGCFLSGCDYGVVMTHGVRFPSESLAALDHASRGLVPAGAPSLPVHPTQLYEAAFAVLGAIVASRVERGRGRRFATWIAIYAVGRFLVEMLRGDVERGFYAGLSTAQWVSLVVLGGLLIGFRSNRSLSLAAPACVFFVSRDASANQDYPPPPPPAYPYPYYAPPPAPYVPPSKPPRPERTIDTRIVLAPVLVMARRDVPSGAAFEAQALYRIPTSANTRFGIGAEFRSTANTLAYHYAAGVPFQFVIEAGRRFDFHFTLALAHTWISFRSPFFASTVAWATRYEMGFNILLGERAMLGFAPVCLNVLSGEDVGVITTYEPRMWFGMSF